MIRWAAMKQVLRHLSHGGPGRRPQRRQGRTTAFQNTRQAAVPLLCW